MTGADIVSKLPYSKPFLFVDEITAVSEDGLTGNFTYDENLDFYKGHFTGNPVTPGVILTETMAQIGLVCLGIFLLKEDFNKNSRIALTATAIEFYKPVYPREKVSVRSSKIYFRFGKLKCKVSMQNEKGEEVCSGIIEGMIR